MAFVVLRYGIYLTVTIQTSALNDSTLIAGKQEFISNYPYGTRLLKQMYRNNTLLQSVELPFDLDLNRDKVTNFVLCYNALQRTENTLDATGYLPDPEYTNEWLSQFESEIYRSQYEFNKMFFAARTRDFVNEKMLRNGGHRD